MAGIGGVVCDRLIGSSQPLKMNSKVWSVPGYDSVGIHLLGKSEGGHKVVAVIYGSVASVQSWFATLSELQGQIVTYQNDEAVLSGPVFVMSVGNLKKQTALFEGGQRGEVEVTVRTV